MSIFTGMPAQDLGELTWRKSPDSSAQGQCVEAARLPDGRCAVRNSRDPQGPALIFTRDEMRAFLAGAKDGFFDGLTE